MSKIVSYEVAKLAKEKGFNWGCKDCFDANGHTYSNGWCERLDYFFKEEDFYNSEIENKIFSKNYFTAPTQSELQKWLRDEYKLHITIHHYKNDTYSVSVTDWVDNSICPELFGEYYYSYEDSLESGLLEGLKLIKNDI